MDGWLLYLTTTFKWDSKLVSTAEGTYEQTVDETSGSDQRSRLPGR